MIPGVVVALAIVAMCAVVGAAAVVRGAQAARRDAEAEIGPSRNGLQASFEILDEARPHE